MKGSSFARRFGAGIGIAVLGVGLSSGIAVAGGNGATHGGGTVHGATAFDALTVTFLPTSTPVTVPAGCWMPVTTEAYMSVSGNAQFHGTSNKNGDWFTATFTGTAAVLPILFQTGAPVKTTTGTVVVTTTAAPFATGHLTLWDGVSLNKNNAVDHATLTFKGTMWTGTAVSMTGQFHFTVLHPVFNTTGTLVGGTFTAAHSSLRCTG